jgi:hypothetical protein
VYANVSAILPLPKNTEKITPVRAKDELPPKWVLEKMAQAVLPEMPAPSEDFPFGDPALDEITF